MMQDPHRTLNNKVRGPRRPLFYVTTLQIVVFVISGGGRVAFTRICGPLVTKKQQNLTAIII